MIPGVAVDNNREAERVTLSERDTRLWLDLPDNPPKPNARLIAAVKALPKSMTTPTWHRRCMRASQEVGGTALMIDAPLSLLLPYGLLVAALRKAGKG